MDSSAPEAPKGTNDPGVRDQEEISQALDLLPELEERVSHIDNRAAQRLRWLNDAVSGRMELFHQGNTDPFRIIQPEAIVEIARTKLERSRGLAALEWVRNVLFFAPLLVTWISFCLAFGSLVSAAFHHPGQSILLLWQQHFYGQSPFSLSDVAFVDSVLIGLLLVVTGAIHGIAGLGQVERERNATELGIALRHALAAATLVIERAAAKRTAEIADRLDLAAGALIREIEAERRRLQSLSNQVSAEVSELVSFATSQKEGASLLLQSGQRLEQLYTRLSESMDRTATGLGSIVEQQRLVATATQSSSSRLEAMVSTLAQAVDALIQTNNGLQTVASALEAEQRSLVAAAERVDTCASKLEAVSSDLKQTQRDAIRALRVGRISVDRLLKRTVDMTDGVGRQLEVLEAVVPMFRAALIDLRFAAPHFRDMPGYGQHVARAAAAHEGATHRLALAADALESAVRMMQLGVAGSNCTPDEDGPDVEVAS